MNIAHLKKYCENSRSAVFVVLLAIYTVLGVLMLEYYRYEGLQANSIGYFAVALQYAKGNFSNAINGFWPPLISWLLIPFIKLGVTPLLGARIINLVTGLFLLIGVRALSYRFEITERLRNIILFSFIPIVLSYTTLIFPDLLLLCILVFYLSIIFNSKYPDRVYYGVLCGLLGAIAYFSKHYAFPFFISHFLLLNILHYLRNTTEATKKNVLRNAIVGIALFSLISGVWVAMISSKYNYFTIGTAGRYNLALVSSEMQGNPKLRGQQTSDPVYYAGLLKPSYETALSAWDDPTLVEVKPQTEARGNFKYRVKHMFKNSYRIIQIFVNFFSFLSISIIIAYILFCIRPFHKLILRGDILYPLVTMGLYSAGYTPFIIYFDNIRYFWIDNVLLLLMGGQVLTVLFRSEFFDNNIKKNLLITFFVLSFVILPVRDIIQKNTRGEENYTLFRKLESEYNIQGNIASNDKWGYTLELVYHQNLNRLNNRSYYYGMPKKNQSNKDLLNELRTHNIDYYFVWSERLSETRTEDSEGKTRFLHKYKDITKGKISGLKIYSLKSE